MLKGFRKFIVMLFMVLAISGAVVSGAEAAGASISKKSANVTAGSKITLTVRNAGKYKVKWSTSDKNVAAIKTNGKKATVTGKKAGKAVITAKVDGKSYKCKVTVKAAAKTGKSSLSSSSLTMFVRDSAMLTVRSAGNSDVSWSTSDKYVAVVQKESEDGKEAKVIAGGIGTCKVTAKVGKKSYVCKVTVQSKYKYDVTVLNPQYNIYCGEESLQVITQPGLLTGCLILYIKTDDPYIDDVSVGKKGSGSSAGFWMDGRYDDVTYQTNDYNVGGINNIRIVKGGYLASFYPDEAGTYYINIFSGYSSFNGYSEGGDKDFDRYYAYADSLVWSSEKTVEVKDFLTAETNWLKSVMSEVTNDTMSVKQKLDELEIYVEKNFKYQMNIDNRLVFPASVFGAYFETGRIDCIVATRIIRGFAELLGLRSESTYAGYLNHHYATIWIDGESYIYDACPLSSTGEVPSIQKII